MQGVRFVLVIIMEACAAFGDLVPEMRKRAVKHDM